MQFKTRPRLFFDFKRPYGDKKIIKKKKNLVKNLLTKISEMVYNHLRLSLRFNAFRRHCYLKLRGKEKNKNSQKVEKTFRLKVL